MGLEQREIMRRIVALAGIVATTACAGDGVAPELGAVDDRVVAVGSELTIELVATDADGDALFYQFESNAASIHQRARLTRSPSGTGVFRWTPLASDVGTWFFDFTVSDGAHDDTVTVAVEVRSAVGQNSAPLFRAPLGTGTTLDLAQKSCVELDVRIDDQDSTSVILGQEEPVIEGATIANDSGLAGTWRWCPSPAQIEADDRYMLVLSADDLANPATQKSYLVVLRKAVKPDCPGAAPIISHTPENESTRAGLTIAATIEDDKGLKREPLLYYATTAPADPPDLGQMTQVTMELLTGTSQRGTWAADVPNPVATAAAGTSASLYYVIVANDDDDETGDCDHLTQEPTTGAYSMTVTNPGGAGGAAVCEPCTADVQCGGAGDLCVRVGVEAEGFCLAACRGGADCGADFTCSAEAVTSVEGVEARQCVPRSSDCRAPGGATCLDDDREDNDSRAQAAANPPLPPAYYELMSCPMGAGDDEDWFRLEIAEESQIELVLVGGTASDLDLGLYDTDGRRLSASQSYSSEEDIGRCVAPGRYYARVFAYGSMPNEYLFEYQASPKRCDACVDDAYEEDDDPARARTVTALPEPYQRSGNAICTGDSDWYRVELLAGETVRADLVFEHTEAGRDLDIYLFGSDGTTNLTPCCNADNGQSTTSNEHLEHTVAADGPYFLKVHGYSGSTNSYDIRVAIEER